MKTFLDDVIRILGSRSGSCDLRQLKRHRFRAWVLKKDKEMREQKEDKEERNNYSSDLQEAINGEIE